MKKRADFYILSTNDPGKKCNFTCQLIEKAYNSGLRLLVWTENVEQAMLLDEQLWQGKPTSFIPHSLSDTQVDAPIIISETVSQEHQFDALLNLSDQLTAQTLPLQRIFEVVSDQPAAQNAARERYKQYRADGFELHTHKIGDKQ